jgi:motility quorum-sensing regulator/GCU-specific mRNA interferase toxin
VEKSRPHCALTIVRELVVKGGIRATVTALADANVMGFDFDGMLAVVMALTSRDFYKSMTTYSDHRIWQDVYRPSTPKGEIYLKLTVIDDVLIVSFKEL